MSEDSEKDNLLNTTKNNNNIYLKQVLTACRAPVGVNGYWLHWRSCQWIMARGASFDLQLFQPIFWREEKGLLGDVHPPQHNDRPDDVQLDDPLPPDRDSGLDRPRLCRPSAGAGQDVPIHAIPENMRCRFRPLCHHLGGHQVCAFLDTVVIIITLKHLAS